MEGAVEARLKVAQQGVDPTELRQVVWVLPPSDNGLLVAACRGHGTEAGQTIREQNARNQMVSGSFVACMIVPAVSVA